MAGRIIGFIIWGLTGLLFVGMGIYAFFSKKPTGFWANAEMFEVTDVKKYNSAVAKLFCAFGIVFILLGLPLLAEENSALIILSVLGTMLETIVMMAIYVTVIENKYKKK